MPVRRRLCWPGSVCYGVLTTLAAAAAVAAGATEPAASGPPPPGVQRIVLVTIDTLRADHVGSYGGPVPTPAFDRLAAEGVLLEQACTPIPTTGPAHASLLTGYHPWRHGTVRNAVPVDPRVPTLPEALRASGFETAAFVSSFMLDRRFGFHQGFDRYHFEPSESYNWKGQVSEAFWARGAATVDAAMRWITERSGGRFFLWVHLFDPHSPYRPPAGYAVSPDDPIDLSTKLLPKGAQSPEHLVRLIRAYRGEVAYADAQLGRLVERLRILGLLDGTALVVTSDHGEGLGDHGLLEHGRTLFDELVRVPLVLRGPGLAAGRRLAGPAQLEDLTPTLLSWAGLALPPDLDGRDLMPWLRGQAAASPRSAVLGRRRPYKNLRDQFYLRRWPEKWIGARERPGIGFGLDADPQELRPAPGTGLAAELAAALALPPLAPESDPADVDPDPQVRRALEALGYLED